MSVEILNADCLDALPRLAAEGFRAHAVVTDPPYHLTSGNAVYDLALTGAGNPRARRSTRGGGFMGKAWDGGDVAFRPETWAAVRDCMLPGAHLLAFGGTRTSHRMVCAIEDAGFEIRDTLMWVYGSGFPKSLDVSKAIDKTRRDNTDWQAVGAWLRERRAAAKVSTKALCAAIGAHGETNHGGAVSNWENGFSCPTWEQWLAMKGVLRFGCGMDAEVWRLNGRKGQPGDAWQDAEVVALRDGTRLAVAPGQGECRDGVTLEDRAPSPEAAAWAGWGTALKPAVEMIILARKPLSEGNVAANVLRHGCGAINVDACRVPAGSDHAANCSRKGVSGIWREHGSAPGVNTEASPLGRWPSNLLHDGSPEVEQAFAAFGDKPTGNLEPHHILRASENGSMSGPNQARNPRRSFGGDTGSASRFFYCAKANKSDRCDSKHPTVKPLQLMSWLVRLSCPEGGTVLDPFAGTGSTGIAADQLGMNAVLIERDAQYAADARRKIAADAPLFANVALSEAAD